MLLCLTAFIANAQNPVNFKLTTSGAFASEDGQDFIVVTFEGKTAHQIFQMLCVNVSKLYKNPKEVMSVVDDASISVRGYDSKVTYIKDLIQTYDVGGYYKLDFEIKDGKVKVNAPVIEENLVRSINQAKEKNYSRMINSWVKDGAFKEKFLKQVEYTEYVQNNLINTILGTNKPKGSDNW